MNVLSMLRQAYDGLALFAIVNLLGLGGLLVYTIASGALDGDRLQRAAAALREVPTPPVTAPQEESVAVPVESGPAADSVTLAGGTDLQIEMEILHREADRIQEELRQRLALNNSILLKVSAQREQFEREQEAAERRSAAMQAEQASAGFQKQLAILEGLSPKLASEHLLGMKDPDEAARFLMAMKTDRGRKVVLSASRGEALNRMQDILRRVRSVSPARAAEIGSEQR